MHCFDRIHSNRVSVWKEGRPVDLAQLRYFCDVAETQHMTRSARRLNIVQPALSRSIHRLEDELGVALFEHVGRNIRLTPEGAFLHERVRTALAGLDGALDELQGFAASRADTVRVAVLSASAVAVDAIAAFAEENPRAAFEITQDADDAHWDVRLDTRLPATARDNALADLQHRVRFTEAIGIALPRSSSLAAPVALEALADHRFICLAGSRRFRTLCDRLCAQRGFTPTIGFDSDSPAVVKKMIGLGLGVGFWPQRSWGSLEGSGARWAPLAEDGFERTLTAALSTRAKPGGMAAAFYGFLTETLAAAWKQA